MIGFFFLIDFFSAGKQRLFYDQGFPITCNKGNPCVETIAEVWRGVPCNICTYPRVKNKRGLIMKNNESSNV